MLVKVILFYIHGFLKALLQIDTNLNIDTNSRIPLITPSHTMYYDYGGRILHNN